MDKADDWLLIYDKRIFKAFLMGDCMKSVKLAHFKNLYWARICVRQYVRTYSRLIFLGKNEINRKLFKEKMQVDSDSIKQVFDIESQDLAIFDKKALIFMKHSTKI